MASESTEKPAAATTPAGQEKAAGLDFRRKLKNEAYLTSGCGKNKAKIRTVDSFWVALWPGLEKLGWTKSQGSGKDEGKIYFRPKTGDTHYTQIKAVIDRVLERRDKEESEVADKYLKEYDVRVAEDVEANAQATQQPSHASPSRPRGRPSNSTPKNPVVDTSWKDAGRTFPRCSSRVGDRYQVTEFPKAGTYSEEGSMKSDDYCAVLWDPGRAKERGVKLDQEEGEDDIISELPSNIREEALVRLSECDYDVNAFQSTLSCIKPSDGSDWTQAKKDKFRDEIFRFRKHLPEVAKSLRVPMNTCLTYYLGTYKSSDDYRLLKTVCVEERTLRMEASERGYDACAICGDGGNLLICDGCEGEYHMECLRPALQSVPEGHWECDECVDKKFLAAREFLVRRTRLFEEEALPGRKSNKRSHDEMESSGDADAGASATEVTAPAAPAPVANSSHNQKVVYRPSDKVQNAIRKLANQLSKVLSGSSGGSRTGAEQQQLS